MPYFDYRQLEADADRLQKRAGSLAAKQNRSAEERDELMSLQGQIHALEDTAGKVKEAELMELRASIARGTAPIVAGPGSYSYDNGAVADFKNFLKTGDTRDVRNAAMSTTDGNGGYLVPESIHATLIEAVRAVDPILDRCAKFDMAAGNDTLLLPMKSVHGVATTAAENAARPQQNAPTFTGNNLTAYDYFTNQYVTQTWLDSVPDSESLLLKWLYEDIWSDKIAVDAAVGSGATSLKGLFAETAAFPTHLSTSAGAILNTNFAALYYGMAAKHRKNAVWIMNAATLATVAGFAHPAATDTLLMKQDVDPPTIFGKPVLECSSAPAIGAANYPIAFVDLAEAYVLGTHRQIMILRDNLTVTPLVRFYALARVGGCGWNPAACHLLKSNNA